MTSAIASVTFLVREYDEAIEFFTAALGFTVLEDRVLSPTRRWVVVSPKSSSGASLLLGRAANPEQVAQVGCQAGGRVFLFLHTTDFATDHAHMKSVGVRFVEEPRTEPYGTVAVFLDLYGNKWDLVQPGSM